MTIAPLAREKEEKKKNEKVLPNGNGSWVLAVKWRHHACQSSILFIDQVKGGILESWTTDKGEKNFYFVFRPFIYKVKVTSTYEQSGRSGRCLSLGSVAWRSISIPWMGSQSIGGLPWWREALYTALSIVKIIIFFQWHIVSFLISNLAEKINFAKYGPSRIDSLGVPYDYKSLMHFGESAFSKNGQPTITPKQEGVSTCTRWLHSIGNVLLSERNNKARSMLRWYWRLNWWHFCTFCKTQYKYCSETNLYITILTGLKILF